MPTLLLLALAAAPDVSLLDTVPSLHVTGVGRSMAAPDKVDVFVTVRTEEPSIEASMRENANRMSAVMAATRTLGIAAADVQLSTVSVSSRNEYDQAGRLKGVFYVVHKELVLCLRTPPKLDALLIELSKVKALVGRIDFASDALHAAEEQLLVKAMQNARERAEKMAAPVGAKVGRALKVHALQTASGNRGMETYSTGGGVSVGEAATGALSATTTVEVDFELLEAKR